MVDPISVGSISTNAATEASQTKEAKRTITNEDFEAVRSTKSAELDTHVDQLKESGLVTGDQIKLASTEAQEMFHRYVQPGNEANGYNSLFHDNRSKLESLRAELDRVGGVQEDSKVGNFLSGLDKEFSSLEGIMNNIDINAPINPLEMIKLQSKMEHISEHVEILSKVVDQISSGIKTVLQTNI
jgi:hypothetical protein